jgi:signal transduction histidine kinase
MEHFVSLKVDTKAIRRMLQNLLDNALKFTAGGGAISLKLQNLEEKIIVEVGDTGPGISLEERKLLFQRFSQGKTEESRLAISKKIVQQHSGKIWVESQPGKGTSFYFSVPAALVSATALL